MIPAPVTTAAATPAERGPVIGSTTTRGHRNVIGTHSGSYSVYRALAVAAHALDPHHKPDLTNTAPTDTIGQHIHPVKFDVMAPAGRATAGTTTPGSSGRTAEGPDRREHPLPGLC